MRLVAAIMTLVTLAASGLAGQRLHETLNTPLPDQAARIAARVETEDATPPAPPARVRQWPAIFGEPQPPAPPSPPPQAEPQPPALQAEPQPPRPPIESLGYALKGVVRVDQKIWAMVSHPTGQSLMRVGDELVEGAEITRIDEQGLWVDYGADTPVLLGFVEEPQPPR